MADLFPDPGSAADYIYNTWYAFEGLGPQIQARANQAIADSQAAKDAQQNDLAALYNSDAKDLLSALENWTQLYAQALPYATQAGLSGLGVWPTVAIVGVSVIIVAAAIYGFMQAYQNLTANLTAPGQASGSSGGIFSGVTGALGATSGLVLVAVFAYFALARKHA